MLEILYEDNHLLAVNKPSGLLTQPSGTQQENLEAFCKAWLKEKYQKPGEVFLEAVHRLDKPVSGVVLFAKTSKALGRLHAVLREKNALKIYLALVEKKPLEEAILEHHLLHASHRSLVTSSETPGAKIARLRYKLLGRTAQGYLLEIALETGRYHQIRAQLAAVGLPIVGDKQYLSSKSFREEQIALHHYRMQLMHPVKPIVLDLKSPAPPWAVLL